MSSFTFRRCVGARAIPSSVDRPEGDAVASSQLSANSYDAQRKSAPASWFRNDPLLTGASSVSNWSVERNAASSLRTCRNNVLT